MPPSKQASTDAAAWQETRTRARDEWPDDRLDVLLDQAVTAIREATRGKHAAYGWSGGKDSVALAHVAELAGVEDCCMAMSNLEFPGFLAWVTDHMPDGLTVINTEHDLRWLARRPNMLFPHGSQSHHWFKIVNHAGQRRYYQEQKLDILLLGRRNADGNFCGPKGEYVYTDRENITRYSPLATWPHAAVFALIDREQLPMPPVYDWPRGYQVGTGPWPSRQWTRDQDHGFEEVWQIDPDVIRAAAPELPAAADWLHRTGRS
ncbi:phosphoadenosine phosphosulfate reductase family protein [Streptomyces arboris]|uniref:phosphoadenosine phosphosulfate reductase domain-containing protein n=1 Tax=Streptomyces arboris TaxID=2600619 RepID=UPI003BF46832